MFQANLTKLTQTLPFFLPFPRKPGKIKHSLMLYFLIGLVGLPLTSWVNPLFASPRPSLSYELNFTPPNRGESPGSSERQGQSTGSRSLGSLHALVPVIGSEPTLNRPIHGGETYADHPVFWLSYDEQVSQENPVSVYLEIRDAETNGQTYFYRTEFFLTQAPGVFRFQLPVDAPPLKNATYVWKFQASQNEQLSGEVVGKIERVELPPEVKAQLANADLKGQAEVYAQWGIWYELLDTLAQLRQENPDHPDYVYAWNDLLQDNTQIMGLIESEAGASQLLPCCTTASNDK